ncbi:glycoside hydrolase family 9 protein, partial [Athelia psychrophila]
GLLWYDGDSDDASLNPALNAAMLMSRYAIMATTSSKQTTYQNFAKAQLDYFLGKNPMNMPYVVGVNPNSPTNRKRAPQMQPL